MDPKASLHVFAAFLGPPKKHDPYGHPDLFTAAFISIKTWKFNWIKSHEVTNTKGPFTSAANGGGKVTASF